MADLFIVAERLKEAQVTCEFVDSSKTVLFVDFTKEGKKKYGAGSDAFDEGLFQKNMERILLENKVFIADANFDFDEDGIAVSVDKANLFSDNEKLTKCIRRIVKGTGLAKPKKLKTTKALG